MRLNKILFHFGLMAIGAYVICKKMNEKPEQILMSQELDNSTYVAGVRG